ncbi:MAG: replication-associated recombination protein A [Chloroflexi bacterium]|nr:replication-associated recombination protein A [Chloroflexota bacterium]
MKRQPPSLPLFPEPAPPDQETDDGPGAPLAARIRPRTLDEMVGQAEVIGSGRVLRRSIEADRLTSLILWGPPGSGKTTLARIIARQTRSHFVALSAVTAGVAEVRRVVEEARQMRRAGRRTILFIDEIHRFNRAQQDATLPHVESGLVVLIGATTENPSFAVNAALLSRCRVFRLEALDDQDVAVLVERALHDTERGLGSQGVVLPEEARQHLVRMAGGDARVALNALELAVTATPPDAAGLRHVGLAAIEDALQHRALLYDKTGDQHYDLISGFIKSVRGSDPDAAVYWLARMLEAGEDPLFVVRRMVILAAEDVGLADPQALVVAVAAMQAVQFIGLPEGYLPLAEAALYLATAPKSNSALAAYQAAREDVAQTGTQPVPLHLRNAVTGLMRGMGYGQGYRYAHTFYQKDGEAGGDLPPAQRLQPYLPPGLEGRAYYHPTGFGEEARLREWLAARRRAAGEDPAEE